MEIVNQGKVHINLVIIGHNNSGKSTISSHLICKCGGIQEPVIDQFEKESADMGRYSFQFAQIFERLKAQREQGMAIDVSLFKFQTEKYNFTIIDSPGHINFIRNMITGTSQADAAILIISSQIDEFYAGFSEQGQTREHIMLAYTLGIKQLIIAVNKMDDSSVNWSSERYYEIKKEVTQYLNRVGYNPDQVPFVPTSGFYGDNLVQKSGNSPWYTEKTIVQCLDDIIPPASPIDQPLRLPVQDVYLISGIGTVCAGRVESGILTPGMIVNFAPNNVISEVGAVQMHNEDVQQAFPGDNIIFQCKDISNVDINRGCVCSEFKNDPAQEVDDFTAQVIITDYPGNIQVGFSPVIDCHTCHIACRLNYIHSKIDCRTGQIIEEEPQFIQSGDSAIITLVPSRRICVEPFSKFMALGRFGIRNMRQNIGIGIIREVTRKITECREPGEANSIQT